MLFPAAFSYQAPAPRCLQPFLPNRSPSRRPLPPPSPPSLPFPSSPPQAAADSPAARAAGRGGSCRVSAAVSRQPQPGQARLPRLLWRQPARSCQTGKATEKRSVGLSTCRCAAAPSWKSQQPSKLSRLLFFSRSAGRLELLGQQLPEECEVSPFPSPTPRPRKRLPRTLRGLGWEAGPKQEMPQALLMES